jgi:formylglycine-generating enzyme required for sulfatase activity
MPWDWPVDVNYHEAKAFCNWKAKMTGQPIRLPSEDEYHAMRDLFPKDVFTWEKGTAGNINLEHWFSSCAIDKFSEKGEKGGGLHDIVGNVWQWTETPIYAFEGYKVH